jgi:hypothetical protein
VGHAENRRNTAGNEPHISVGVPNTLDEALIHAALYSQLNSTISDTFRM